MPNTESKGWRRLPVVYVKEGSSGWNRERFRAAIDFRPRHQLFGVIAHRRHELAQIAPYHRHESYDEHLAKTESTKVDASKISIPPRYGALLYSLAKESGARFVMEAGSGFGISTMYLAAAVGQKRRHGIFSFEIADYAEIAQESVGIITPNAKIVHDNCLKLSCYIPADFRCDFAFIDAQHDHENIIKTYNTMLGWMAPGHLIVIDDIQYSGSSRAAWKKIALSRDDRFVALINNRLGVIAT